MGKDFLGKEIMIKEHYKYLFLFLGFIVISIVCLYMNILKINKAFITAIPLLDYELGWFDIIRISLERFYYYWMPSVLLFLVSLMNFIVLYRKGSLRDGWSEFMKELEYKKEG